MLDAYVAAGGNFIDTADVYNTSEDAIGRWLAKKDPAFRSSLIIATKFGNQFGPDENDRGASRKHIQDAVASSLRRLQTSYIDLYQQHLWCGDSELEETMFALHELVTAGKVRYIGCSNFSSWQLNEANRIAREHSLTPFISLQQQYSLLCRTLEWDIIDVVQKDGVGILPWSPLAGGWLSGKYKKGSSEEGGRVAWAESVGWAATSFSTHATDFGFGVVDEVRKISKETGQPVAAVSLRWLLQRDSVSSVLIGARTLQQLSDNLQAAHFTLSAEQMDRLNSVSNTPMPYPYSLQKSGALPARK